MNEKFQLQNGLKETRKPTPIVHYSQKVFVF